MVTPTGIIDRPHRPTRRSQATGRTAGPVSLIRGRAFSLAELLMVMAIMGTIAAIAAPRFVEAETRWRVTGAARRIAADLERARAIAIATSADVKVVFNATGYEVDSASDLIDADTFGRVELRARPYLARIRTVDFGGESTLTINGAGIGSADGKVIVGADRFLVAVTYTASGTKPEIGAPYAATAMEIEILKGGTVEPEDK